MLVIAAYDMRPPRRLADQGGMAVVVALLVLALLSLLGITLMGFSVTESQIGSNESDLKKALFAAEAGIQEAMYRMRLDPGTSSNEGDPPVCSTIPDPVVIGKQGTPAPSWADPGNTNFWKYNPPTCAWTYTPDADSDPRPPGNFFGGKPGNLDSAGRTFTSSGATHAGALVNANLTNGGSYAVTVAPVVGHNGTCWQYVDQHSNPLPGSSCAPASLPEPFNPLFKVTSIGTARDGRKVLSTMIKRFSINPQPDGALTANTNVDIQSAAAVIDGGDHTCVGNEIPGVDGIQAATAPSGPSGVDILQPDNLVCAVGTGDACKDFSSIFPSTIGELLLGPGATTAQRTAQINALNAYLESIKVPPASAPPKDGPPFHGILYVDGNYEMPPDGSTGILIVHNATDNANLGNFDGGIFKGLIIADKINKINGNAQIIGAIFAFGSAADGVVVDDITGTPTIKYSKCIIDSLPNLANFPFEVVKGTWHER